MSFFSDTLDTELGVGGARDLNMWNNGRQMGYHPPTQRCWFISITGYTVLTPLSLSRTPKHASHTNAHGRLVVCYVSQALYVLL